MQYKISMTRKTYDTLVRYMSQWGSLYKLPGVTSVLAGSLRKGALEKKCAQAFVDSTTGLGDAKALALRFDCAAHGLGRAHVTSTVVKLDLRDLLAEEIDALVLMSRIANVKGMQAKALIRIRELLKEFRDLDPLTRLAIMAED